MTDHSACNTADLPTVSCVICLQYQPLQYVTAGSLYASGRQAFACTIHLTNRYEWITAWALFDRLQLSSASHEFEEVYA
jgi:hypothetical protein